MTPAQPAAEKDAENLVSPSEDGQQTSDNVAAAEATQTQLVAEDELEAVRFSLNSSARG